MKRWWHGNPTTQFTGKPLPCIKTEMKMENEFLRHTLSTIAYRFRKAVGNAETEFGNFSAGRESRTPIEIINHMYYVLRATRLFIDEEKYNQVQPEELDLKLEMNRFNAELKNLDNVIVNKELEINYTKRLIQGPLSDILTHIGQISMLSRLNGNPIMEEDFSSAPITTGIA